MLRYFNITPETNEENLTLSKIINCYGVTYKYIKVDKPSSIDNIDNFNYGNYNIIVDTIKYNTIKNLDIFSKYEYVYINYDNDRLNEIINDKLSEQSKLIFNDFLKYYNYNIEQEVQKRYNKFVENFINENLNANEICSLYRNYINNEISFITNKIISILSPTQFKEFDKFFNDDNYSKYYEYIKYLKNTIVDEILKICGAKRGTKEYFNQLRFAGHIANILENILANKYIPNIDDIKNIILDYERLRET